MLTGDSERNAKHVADELGIDMVYARLLPGRKVKQLKSDPKGKWKSHVCGRSEQRCALVLAGADVGAAMGSGADAAVEAADVVFMNSGMRAVAQAFALALKTGLVARENVIFALVVKALIMGARTGGICKHVVGGICGYRSGDDLYSELSPAFVREI